MKKLLLSNNTKKFVEISADFLILSLAVWAEFGFAAFSSGTTIESIDNPLQKYLYPNITDEKSDLIKNWVSIIAQILAYTDAGLTIASVLDVRDKRKKFFTDFIKGIQYLRNGDIGFVAFILNTTLFMISFLTNSLSPWTGLKMAGKEGRFLKSLG